MLMPASSEFVALCQAQVALLTRGLGAALSIIYLTEELTEAADAKMLPVVAYPETAVGWGEDRIFSLLAREQKRVGLRSLAPDTKSLEASPTVSVIPAYSSAREAVEHPLEAAEQALSRQQQIVLPLIHEGVVMGLLVTARADRAWTEIEHTQIEQIADTLALACVLDQRSQWLAHDLRQQRLLREQRRDLFDNLLHQFRNPMTAMRTFGKLMLKRMRASDINRSAAEGIVRESDRLQELLKQFDAAIDLDETELSRLLSGAEPDEMLTQPPPKLLSAGSSSSANLLVGTSVQLEPRQVAEVLQPLLDSARAIAQDRQLVLQVAIPSLPPVQLDVRALREVLNNIIDNALKYTPAGGQVDIIVESQPAELGQSKLGQPGLDQSAVKPLNRQAIAILDTGPGIPQQDLARLFERHYRGVQAATAIPGTGLGLAIARDLVHQMQGEIRVFSPASTSEFASRIRKLNANRPPPTPASNGTAVVIWLPEASPDSGAGNS